MSKSLKWSADGLPPASVRVFVAGNSGSGKTTLADRMYLQRAPRVIYLDMTGEWEHRADAVAYSARDVVQHVRALAGRGRWRIAASIGPDELEGLVNYLIPVPDLQRSPVRALGGCVLLVDEVDLFAPQGTASEPIRTLYRRSRHVGLTVVSTTQRPANVSREVSAQSTHAVALHLSEPRDIDYITRLMRWTPQQVAEYQAWTRRHPHGAVWRDLQGGQALTVDDRGAVRRWQASQADAFSGEQA